MPTRQAGGFRKRPITHIGCEGDPTPLICPPEVFLLVEEGDVAECVEGRATYSFTITNAETEIIAGNALALTWLLDGSPLDVVATNATFTEDTAFTTIEADGTELNVTGTWAAGQTVTVTVTIDNTDCEELQTITLTAIGTPPLSEIDQADNTAESEFVPEVPVLGLRMLFDDIVNMPFGITDPTNVGQWNTFYDLPTNGAVFTSAVVAGNQVTLVGGGAMSVLASVFSGNANLLEIHDDAGIVIELLDSAFAFSALTDVTFDSATAIGEIGGGGVFTGSASLANVSLLGAVNFYSSGLNGAFKGCSSIVNLSLPSTLLLTPFFLFNATSLQTFSAPLATDLPGNGMENCTSITTIDLTSCINLGTDPTDASVFNGITGQTVRLDIAAVNATNNGGGVHASVAYLIANNTATVNYI